MKRIKLTSFLALSLFVMALPMAASAAPAADKAEKPAAADTAKKAKPISYQGTAGSVDKEKKSFTIKSAKGEELTLVATDTTKYLDKKEPKKTVKFEDIVTDGAYLTGSYVKNGDTLNAYSVHAGSTAPSEKASKKAKATPSATPEAPAK